MSLLLIHLIFNFNKYKKSSTGRVTYQLTPCRAAEEANPFFRHSYNNVNIIIGRLPLS